MVNIEKLNDAAVAIDRVLREGNCEFEIFGGLALATIGSYRETRDIDCAVASGKPQLVEYLRQKEGFRSLENARADLASFLYREDNVLIKFFPMHMGKLRTVTVSVTGARCGQSKTVILEPLFLYKSKLAAAGNRSKDLDATDLLFLESTHREAIEKYSDEIYMSHMGRALARYPHLEQSFLSLGIDMDGCRAMAEAGRPSPLDGLPRLNAIQEALCFNWKSVTGAPVVDESSSKVADL